MGPPALDTDERLRRIGASPLACHAMTRQVSPTPEVLQTFRPCPGLAHPHVQTVVAAALTWSWEPPAATRLVTLPDGDRIALAVSTPVGWQAQRPTVLMVHGLCGSHRSPYMQRLARKLLRRGLRVVRMNLRGCGSGMGLARQPYHSGRSADVYAVVQSLHQEAPHSPLTLVGFSLGGNIALKLAGESANTLPLSLQHVIAVCPPADLAACVRLLAQPANRLYDVYFTRQLCRDVRKRHACFPDLPPPRLPARWSLYAFDACYTAPQCGFQSADDYYQQCSAAPLVAHIALPCHILFAADDPLIDARVFDGVSLPSHVQVLCTRAGGHLGFLGRPGGYRAMDAQLVAWIMHGLATSGSLAPEPSLR